MKIGIIGDIHFRINTPVSRLDDIKETFIEKFTQVSEILDEKRVKTIFLTGDVFDKSKVPNETLLLAKKCLNMFPTDSTIYTVVGNHDMIGNSLNSYENTSLAILDKLVPNLKVIINKNKVISKDVVTKFNAYGNNNFDMDLMGMQRNIILTHTMISENVEMFDTSLAKDVVSQADLIITGHNHNKFLVTSKSNTIIYNPGALIRLTAAKDDMGREVEVGIYETNTNMLERINLNLRDSFDKELIEKKKENIKQIMDDTLGSMSDIFTSEEVVNYIFKKHGVPGNIKTKVLEYIKL